MINRRETLGGMGAVALSGCVRPCAGISLPTAVGGPHVADGHCHMFNVKDLSAIRFISRVFLSNYPTLARSEFTPEDPTAIDRVVGVFLALVGAGSAPSAVTEAALLRGRSLGRPGEDRQPVPSAAETERTIARTARFLGGAGLGGDPDAERTVRSLIVAAGGDGRSDLAPETPLARLELAHRAVTGGAGRNGAARSGLGLDVSGFFHFAAQLRRFRHCLVDELSLLHRSAGQNPVMMAPAMVDFGRWLRDDPAAGSTFQEQVSTWSLISRRHSGPAVHGYVGFCPLRQVQFDRGLLGPGRRIQTPCDDDPLATVRSALTDHGFLGVKLYPPMGFRPAANRSRGAAGPYPQEILSDVFGTEDAANAAKLGAELDAALDRLYSLCSELGAPILAHAANSNAAFEGSGAHADPFHWRPVFDRPCAPAVMLAHFGGFQYRSADPEAARGDDPDGAVPFEATWEASLARYVARHPERPVFADVSMFTELFDAERRAFLLGRFRELDRRYPAMATRLVFGTDWHMLATQPRAAEFDGLVCAFLTEAFGSARLDDLMRRNFIRFAGLAPGGRSRQRIESFYAGDTALLDRLRSLDEPQPRALGAADRQGAFCITQSR